MLRSMDIASMLIGSKNGADGVSQVRFLLNYRHLRYASWATSEGGIGSKNRENGVSQVRFLLNYRRLGCVAWTTPWGGMALKWRNVCFFLITRSYFTQTGKRQRGLAFRVSCSGS